RTQERSWRDRGLEKAGDVFPSPLGLAALRRRRSGGERGGGRGLSSSGFWGAPGSKVCTPIGTLHRTPDSECPKNWRSFALSHRTRRAAAPSQRVGKGRGESPFSPGS